MIQSKRSMTGAMAMLLSAAALCAAAPAGQILLRGDGLVAGGKPLVFGRSLRADAIAAVTRILGKPNKIGSHGDCGQGDVIAYARFRGDFELSFVKGKLAGWSEDGQTLATDKGIRAGSSVAALRKAYRDVSIDSGDEANGGVGPSFQREAGPNGWLDGTKPNSHVSGLFAGATCLPGA